MGGTGQSKLNSAWAATGDNIIYTQKGEKVTMDDFDLLTVIGKGSFGKVMQVRKKNTGKIYAMKVLRKESILERNQIEHTKAEKAILQQIQHPFIVSLKYAFQTEDKLYLVMEFVNGGELFFHLKKEGRFSEDRVKFYAAEIMLALAHLHEHDIVYRDLKPENLLIDAEGHIRITDFGLSKQITVKEGDKVTYTFCGTPEYLAPEVLENQGHGPPVDWWSLGTLIYEMLTGLPPFYSQNVNVMYHKILHQDLRFPPYVSSDAKDLIKKMVERDVKKRLGTNGVKEIKSHPFFKGIDFDKVEKKKLPTPFKPPVKAETDISQFDSMFTDEPAQDTIVQKKLTPEEAKLVDFDDFEFIQVPKDKQGKDKGKGKSTGRGGSKRDKGDKKSRSKSSKSKK